MATRDPRGDGTGAVTTGGGTEPMVRPAAVHPNASSHTRPDVPPMLGKLAAWSWRLLVVLAAVGLLLYLLIQLKVIVVPVIVALFLATLLVPLVHWLERRGWKHLPAVLAVFGGAVLLIAAIVTGLVPLIGNELDTLRQRADEGVAEVQRYIASRPFGLSEADLNRYLEQARQRFTDNSSGLTRGAVAGVTVAGEVITGLILSLFLTFFFVKDSERFTRWLLDFAGRQRAPHLREIGTRSATAVSGYLRGQAAVGAVDAIFIGIGLAILGVPLVVPLAFLTFVAAFLPLVGAVVAGVLAALVALVTKGVTTALIVVGITLPARGTGGGTGRTGRARTRGERPSCCTTVTRPRRRWRPSCSRS
jgi:putative heme transporter